MLAASDTLDITHDYLMIIYDDHESQNINDRRVAIELDLECEPTVLLGKRYDFDFENTAVFEF